MKYFSFKQFNSILLLAFSSSAFAVSNPPLPVGGETAASLACIYGLTPTVPGCPIKGTSLVPTTGSGAIVIIDGQDDPDAFNELQQFSAQLGLYSLPKCTGSNAPCFEQYYVDPTSNPPCISATVANGLGFHAKHYDIETTSDVEPEIDIEWAHAMAPHASIYMVETQGWLLTTNPNLPNTTGLINGLQCATYLLQKYHNGRGIVSYSNSNQEWPGETAVDAYFQTPGIIYVASAGDYSAPARYPAASPYVIGAGGTMIQRDSVGNYISQVTWKEPRPVCNAEGTDCKTGATGGPSVYEQRPSYQNNIRKIVGNQRGTPDFSFVAKGVDVFCCQLPNATNYSGNNCCGVSGKPACQSLDTTLCTSGLGAWITDGGTSLAAPALAGIINSAHSSATTSAEELSIIYNGAVKNYHTNWTDIVSGNNGYPALTGYDFATGLGVPRGYAGK